MIDTIATPKIKLNNGVELPSLGFGVFQSSPPDTVGAVSDDGATGEPTYRMTLFTVSPISIAPD